MKNFKIKILILLAIGIVANLTQISRAEEIMPEPETPPIEEIIPAPETPAPIEQTVDVLIRSEDKIIYQGVAALPETNTMDIPDSTGTIHSINSKSVLGVLYSISQASNAFTLSDLEYYASYNSFYLKCLTPINQTEVCNNWQYIINNVTPYTSMDSTILSGNEKLGIYFGSPHHVVFDNTSIKVGEPLKTTAENYNYIDNTWSPLTGINIAITAPNPNDPYNPTVVLSQPVDSTGSTIFNIPNTGSYDVGIAEDYYFPSYKVTVFEPVAIIINGGGISAPANPVFSIPNAVNYLASVQSTDGSFAGNDMYTDWVSIALGAMEPETKISEMKTKILDYMNQHNTPSSMLTDAERHSMALLALGQNPYSFAGIDYISPIIKSFDGNQFGDPSLVNDDVFAIIPLARSGYTKDDSIIAKDIQFIISKQKPDGSWEDSIDFTSATIQALAPFNSTNEISDSIKKASNYLQTKQNNDGGFDSIYSTSWVIGAMNALNTSWAKNGHSAVDIISKSQAPDGAALPISEKTQNRIWATSYAIPAVLGKSWNAIMHEAQKPLEQIAISPQIKTTNIEMENPTPIIKTEKVKLPEQKIITKENHQELANTHTISPAVMTASAENSKTQIPTLTIITTILAVGGLIFSLRKVIYKK